MTIQVDIADRLYDYTDEEKAAEVVAEFQEATGLNDAAIVELWANEKHPQRRELERLISQAVDLNGTARRASQHIPAEINLLVA